MNRMNDRKIDLLITVFRNISDKVKGNNEVHISDDYKINNTNELLQTRFKEWNDLPSVVYVLILDYFDLSSWFVWYIFRDHVCIDISGNSGDVGNRDKINGNNKARIDEVLIQSCKSKIKCIKNTYNQDNQDNESNNIKEAIISNITKNNYQYDKHLFLYICHCALTLPSKKLYKDIYSISNSITINTSDIFFHLKMYLFRFVKSPVYAPCVYFVSSISYYRLVVFIRNIYNKYDKLIPKFVHDFLSKRSSHLQRLIFFAIFSILFHRFMKLIERSFLSGTDYLLSLETRTEKQYKLSVNNRFYYVWSSIVDELIVFKSR